MSTWIEKATQNLGVAESTVELMDELLREVAGENAHAPDVATMVMSDLGDAAIRFATEGMRQWTDEPESKTEWIMEWGMLAHDGVVIAKELLRLALMERHLGIGIEGHAEEEWEAQQAEKRLEEQSAGTGEGSPEPGGQ